MGAVSADLELDALKDAADAEILAVRGALGRYVPLIAAFCRSRCAAAKWAYLLSSMNISIWFVWPGCERSGGALGRRVPLVSASCRGRWVGTYDLAREAANA